MTTRLAYLHTVASLAAAFKALSDELIPAVDFYHVVDESLLQNTIRLNRLTNTTVRRFAAYLVAAEEGGADLVLVTCSSLGPAVEACRRLVNIPVLRVDEPMADLAVQTGDRIGAIATLSTTLQPTTEILESRAKATGKKVEIIPRLCEGAFEAVISGDAEGHDQLVKSGLQALISSNVDVIVLAQASMARVVASLSADEQRIPVLSSPRLAVEHLSRFIPSLEKASAG